MIHWQPKSRISKSTSEHAVHIHQYGTIENENGDVNCDGSGQHFNKADQKHGEPSTAPPERSSHLSNSHAIGKNCRLVTKYFRHYGDLGNIIRADDGHMRLYFIDKHISLKANNQSYVGGRTLDFHEFKDDWSSDANSGRRVACCLIEHGDIIQSPGDNDVIVTSSTEKVTDTSTISKTTTLESTSESTTTDSTTEVLSKGLLSAFIFSSLCILLL